MPLRTSAPLVAVILAAAAPLALAATQTHEITFTGAGGDARFGYGATPDSTYNFNVYNILPLFDPSLGTLERVSYSLTGWRSFDGVCTVPNHPDAAGGCSARIEGRFYLESTNHATWPPTLPIGEIRTYTENFAGVTPPIGGSLPINLLAHASTSGEITDAGTLATFFTVSGQPQQGIHLRFAPGDGGTFGYGGGASFSAMLWDADATVRLTYHYAAPIPEPGSLALMLAGMAGVGLLVRRRSARKD